MKNTFLHGELKENVYMHKPLGYNDLELPHHVNLLREFFYGLKQAPQAWYKQFTDYVSSIGISQSMTIVSSSTKNILI